ncbi:MAG TPA: hypothetical protein VJ866_02655 [Pyrinomonadaceae bacterium]|nr:hypothetical protein [Pyrinomonadaceae bacterium]
MPERFDGINPSEGRYLSTNDETDEEYKRQLEAKQGKLGRFKLFQTVNIERNSGQVESDWIIAGYNDEKDRVVVTKKQSPQEIAAEATAIGKMVKKEDLEKWNPE